MKKHLKLFGMVAGIPLLGLVTSLSAKSNEYTSLLLPASLIALTSGVLLLACIYFLAKYAASNRTLLLRIFSPGIDDGNLIDHQDVKAWADSLGAETPLPVPHR